MREATPRLGRGLAVLLGQPANGVSDARLQLLALDALESNPFQPRAAIDPALLAELTESIRQQGVLQPLLVREAGKTAKWQIVAGERRWRAAREAGLTEIPCLVHAFTDQEAAMVALVENLQRQDLGPLEEAEGLRRMASQFGLRQEELAQAVGKSRSHVANTMRLLNLPAEVQAYVREGKLSAGHARALLTYADPVAAARTAIARDLSVRQVEALTSTRLGADEPPARDRRQPSPVDPDLVALEAELAKHLGLRVDIADRHGAGRVTIHYRSLDQLDGLLTLLKSG